MEKYHRSILTMSQHTIQRLQLPWPDRPTQSHALQSHPAMGLQCTPIRFSKIRGRGYTNRYQWGNNWDYGPSITWMKNNVQQRSRWDMSAEQMKYAEVQACRGVTAVQGSPGSVLTHGIVCYLETSSCITSGKMESVPVLYAVQQMMTTLEIILFLKTNQVHSMHGSFTFLRCRRAAKEFDALWNKGLIMDETVVIHGTGMDASQFNLMGTTGAGLVWSPFSNLVLYGDTTDVVAADNAGITISIAPDWGPSGTKQPSRIEGCRHVE